MNTYIHLLYVPTMACNMACRYCYLEDGTKDIRTERTPLETLRHAVEKCRAENIVPFNISLHGGEVTCLSPEDFRELAAYISDYYKKNGLEWWYIECDVDGQTARGFIECSDAQFRLGN